MSHFIASSHGNLTLLEPLTDLARKFLSSFGFRPGPVALHYGDYKELRYAANGLGLRIEVEGK